MYYLEGSFNMRQMANYTRNALTNVTALLCGRGDEADSNVPVKGSDFAHLHRINGRLLDSREPDFPRNLADVQTKLSPRDAILAIFNANNGTATAMGDAASAGGRFRPADHLFTNADYLLVTPLRKTGGGG
jgi:hypothetical protein